MGNKIKGLNRRSNELQGKELKRKKFRYSIPDSVLNKRSLEIQNFVLTGNKAQGDYSDVRALVPKIAYKKND